MTDVDVGSSALLGLWHRPNTSVIARALTTDGAGGLECVEVIEGEAAISGHRGSSGRKSLTFVAEPKASGLGKVINEPTGSGRARASQRRARFCPTSKMSHDASGRDSCSMTIWILQIHSENPTIARGVTDRGVGSGALFGGPRQSKWGQLWAPLVCEA